MTSRDASLAPLAVRILDDPPLLEKQEHFLDTNQYNGRTPIAIDFGTTHLRAGYVTGAIPSHVLPTRLTRYKDRKMNRTMTFIGNDTNLDPAVRSQSRSPFDGPFVNNWEYIEEMLEYTFNHLGVVPNYGVSNPLIISEKLATIQSQRAHWYQILFETFNLSEITFGVDNLFAYHAHNSIDSTGLIIGCNNEDTNVIPVVEGQAVLTDSKRINWGGHQSVTYLNELLALKYPYFPTKITELQYQQLYHDYCYISPNYSEEIEKCMTLDYLESKNVVVEAPFAEVTVPQKSEEELKLQAEKRKETGRRLQEQAKQKRVENLIQKQEEHDYYSQLREQMIDQPKKKIISILQNAGFDDERDFKKYMYSLEKSLKKANSEDLLDDDAEDGETNKFELVDIPDDQLTEDQIKEKRKQRLMKANLEARLRAKEEKEKALKEEEELKRKEEEWRTNDLDGWIKEKKLRLNKLMASRKEKLKIREEMKDRKSQAFQNRMKSLATLAEDNVRGNSKRSRQQATIDNDPNDTFGANDEDWMVYSDIYQSQEALNEAIEEDYNNIVDIEKELLEFDPNFTGEDTLDAQYNWRDSILHLFLRGPRPHDGEDPHQQHQMHLNVERIRVPEVLFQPKMGGCDQAGISELSETILLKKFGTQGNTLSDVANAMTKNIFLTGGNSILPGLKQRIVREFEEFLPSNTKTVVSVSKTPSLDAWKGMAKWSSNPEALKSSMISKKQYEEYGAEYIKEHKMGNVPFFE